VANYRQIHRNHNRVHHRNSTNCSCKTVRERKRKKTSIDLIFLSEGDTNANENAKEAKVAKNAVEWLKKVAQKPNIDANYDIQDDRKEGAQETTNTKGLMSYCQRSDRKRDNIPNNVDMGRDLDINVEQTVQDVHDNLTSSALSKNNKN
jgi:hypothetical protein